MVAFYGIFTFTFTGLPFTRVVEQKALDRARTGECMHDAYGDGARARNFKGQCGMPSSLCGVPFDIKLGAGPSETNLMHWSRGSVAVRLRVTTAPARRRRRAARTAAGLTQNLRHSMTPPPTDWGCCRMSPYLMIRYPGEIISL